MVNTNVYIDGKAEGLLIKKVCIAFLFCLSLFIQAQRFIYLTDSTVVSIKEGTYISGVLSEIQKAKIYVIEGTYVKNFGVHQLANADIIHIKKKKSSSQKNIYINRAVEKFLPKISTTKHLKTSELSFVVENLDSENNLFVSELVRFVFAVPSYQQCSKALPETVLKIEKIIAARQIGCISPHKTDCYINCPISFIVRPPPAFV
ncbi:hypothetical protein [Cloacibacterium sp.]|uniref:hypothetical protein n=1 Tax=Cloacibacterium sp. TaxID=1913682 RepID=UPI0039E3636B